MKALWNLSFKMLFFFSDFKQIFAWLLLIDIACLELSDWSFLHFHVTCIIHMTQHHFCKVETIFSCQWFTLLHYSSIMAQNTLYSQYQRNTQCSENLTKAVQISPRAATSCIIAVDVSRNSYRSIKVFTFALYFFVKLYFQFSSIE